MLLFAAILAVAAIWINLTPRETQRPVSLVSVVVAGRDIPPYTVISPDQVGMGATQIPDTLAVDYYDRTDDVVGYMTTRAIKAGQLISREDAKPIAEVRYVEDMGLEIVSFPAVFSEMVAGQVKPGQRINIYGYEEETGKDAPGEAILVASNVWVVDVRTSIGEEVKGEEQQPEQESALFSAPGLAGFSQPASVVAVAAPPTVVQDIIYALGAKGYSAWVTLAPSPENIPPVATLATPTPQPTAYPQQTPSVPPASTSLSGAVYMSDRDGGPKVDVFPNNTSIVWAVVNLQYTPDGALPITIAVRDQGGVVAFSGSFSHPQSGQQSYLIVPTEQFAPDTAYQTELSTGDESFYAEWRLHGNATLPNTGGSDHAF